MNIGLKLKVKRIEKGVTQRELGAVIGVTEQTISLYERGKLLPKVSHMKILSDFLEVSVQDLFFS